jgi:hypothetical protein
LLVEIDTNAYNVPWRLIGETVRVVVAGGRVSVRHKDQEVAAHPESAGRRQRLIDKAHFCRHHAAAAAAGHNAACRHSTSHGAAAAAQGIRATDRGSW